MTPGLVRQKYQELRKKAKLDPQSVDPKYFEIIMFDGRSLSSARNIKKAHNMRPPKQEKEQILKDHGKKCLSKDESLIRLLDKLGMKSSSKKGESKSGREDERSNLL